MPKRAPQTEETKAEAFARHYLDANCNGTEAMRRMGHAGTPDVLANAAWRMLRSAKVQEQLAALRLDLSMTADETVQRMTEWGRANMLDLLDDEGELDLGKVRRADRGRLLKEIVITRETRPSRRKGGKPVQIVRTAVKLHDAKDAVTTMMRKHGLLKDKLEVGADAKALAQLMALAHQQESA